jgi:hypothetical protein
MVDWRIIANGRDGMLSALHAIRTLAGHTVRVRVVDGMDDLYAVGYVHEAGKDKSAQNIPQQTETGSLTIVCQRPEILSWSASESQLFPVSRVSGGLSYGVPAYELAWTGTANSSTSTLSQDGAVVATNLVTSPKPLAAGWLQNANTMTDTPDGLAVSAHDPNSDEYASTFNILCNPDTTYHIVADLARIDGPTLPNGPLFVVEWTATNARAATHVAIGGIKQGILQTDFTTQPTATSINIRLYAPMDVTQETVWRHIGLYTAADWSAMQARGITWFDGDSQSPQPNAGLSYGPDGRGLSYGVSAEGERNLAVLSNHGTTNAYPTLTVTGPFPDGVEIQTGVGGVIRYTGAIGMVPLVLQCDPRNVAASMGGVDVGRYLTGRDLPAIPAGGSMSLRLMSAGSGWVTVTMRDTYL